MRQTKAETERTRLALLNAAEALFWKRGAARTSVLDIAKTAGLTRGAFYHHFKDKAAIFQALIDRSRTIEKDLPNTAEVNDADALVVLRAYCLNVFKVFVEDRSQQRMFGIVMQRREALGELEPLAQQRREEICRTSQLYESLLKRAQRAGRLSADWTPQIAAMTLYSAILGLVDQWLRSPGQFDVRKIGVACINQLFDTFECKPANRARKDGRRSSSLP